MFHANTHTHARTHTHAHTHVHTHAHTNAHLHQARNANTKFVSLLPVQCSHAFSDIQGQAPESYARTCTRAHTQARPPLPLPAHPPNCERMCKSLCPPVLQPLPPLHLQLVVRVLEHPHARREIALGKKQRQERQQEVGVGEEGHSLRERRRSTRPSGLKWRHPRQVSVAGAVKRACVCVRVCLHVCVHVCVPCNISTTCESG